MRPFSRFSRRGLAEPPTRFTFASRGLRPDLSSTPDGARRIWQKRFYDFKVWTERKRIEKLRSMHRNPVKRGLVASPELWRWSSFRAYFPGEACRVRVNEWEVLKMKIRPPAA